MTDTCVADAVWISLIHKEEISKHPPPINCCGLGCLPAAAALIRCVISIYYIILSPRNGWESERRTSNIRLLLYHAVMSSSSSSGFRTDSDIYIIFRRLPWAARQTHLNLHVDISLLRKYCIDYVISLSAFRGSFQLDTSISGSKCNSKLLFLGLLTNYFCTNVGWINYDLGLKWQEVECRNEYLTAWIWRQVRTIDWQVLAYCPVSVF